MEFENPYQTPLSAEPTQPDIQVSERFLLMPKDTSLPECCVKCGAPAAKRYTQKLYWVSPWVYLCILLNLLILIIVYLITRKTTKVSYSLCEQHAREKRIRAWTIAGCWAVIAVFLVASAALESMVPVALAGLTLLALVIYAIARPMTLSVKKFDKERFWIKGAGDEMLARYEANQSA